MEDLKIFESGTFGKIRVITISDKPYFCGCDVTKALGYKNIRDALLRHCRGVVKHDTLTAGGKQELAFIPEADVYRLVFSSKLSEAERFTDWVTEEVLPSIRNYGVYLTNSSIEKILSDPETIIHIATELKEERTKRQQLEFKIEADKPKVLVAEAVSETDKLILIRDLAKILKQNDINIGEKRLFEWLRDKGYLISRHGSDYNMPTQKSMNLKLFRVVTHRVELDNSVSIKATPKVTGKGQIYFINKFLTEKLGGVRNGRSNY